MRFPAQMIPADPAQPLEWFSSSSGQLHGNKNIHEGYSGQGRGSTCSKYLDLTQKPDFIPFLLLLFYF